VLCSTPHALLLSDSAIKKPNRCRLSSCILSPKCTTGLRVGCSYRLSPLLLKFIFRVNDGDYEGFPWVDCDVHPLPASFRHFSACISKVGCQSPTRKVVRTCWVRLGCFLHSLTVREWVAGLHKCPPLVIGGQTPQGCECLKITKHNFRVGGHGLLLKVVRASSRLCRKIRAPQPLPDSSGCAKCPLLIFAAKFRYRWQAPRPCQQMDGPQGLAIGTVGAKKH